MTTPAPPPRRTTGQQRSPRRRGSVHNLGCIATAVPPKVTLGCGLDYDTWYPLPRRLLGMTDFMAHLRAERRHNRATVDTIAARFGVRCGPLDSNAAAGDRRCVANVAGTRARASPADTSSRPNRRSPTVTSIRMEPGRPIRTAQRRRR